MLLAKADIASSFQRVSAQCSLCESEKSFGQQCLPQPGWSAQPQGVPTSPLRTCQPMTSSPPTCQHSSRCRCPRPGPAGAQCYGGQEAQAGRGTRMTEHDFRFFESEWEFYKRATKITGQTLVNELWSCMSSELKKLAFDQGDTEP